MKEKHFCYLIILIALFVLCAVINNTHKKQNRENTRESIEKLFNT